MLIWRLLPLSAFDEAGRSELLAVTAICDECFFEGGNVLIEQVIRLVDQTERGIRADRRIGVVKPAG